MTAVVRHTSVTNSTGALLTTVPINVGQEYAGITITWTFSAADIGTSAGQTKDGTNPCKGFLFGQIQGAAIKEVISAMLVRTVTINGTNFENIVYGSTTPNIAGLAFRIDNSVAGVSSLYLYDNGTGTTTAIINAGDKVKVLLELGNT